MIDLDASVVVCHCEKEQAAPTFKKTFGYPPDARVLRQHRRVPRRAAAARATRAATPPPTTSPSWTPRWRRSPTSTGTAPRSWSAPTRAGCTREFLAHIRSLREQAVSCEFSVGWAITAKERAAIAAIPAWLWADAVDADGGHRDGAGLAEITRLLPARVAGRLPARDPGDRAPGTAAPRRAARRVRRGRRLALHRFATDTRVGQLAFLEPATAPTPGSRTASAARKDTGLGRFPSRSVRDQPGLAELVMLAVDLIAWTQTPAALTATWPRPNRRRCATGCCTSPPGSPADSAGSGCASNSPGPGPATSPPPSPGSRRCPSRPVDRRARHDERRELPAEPARRPPDHVHSQKRQPAEPGHDHKIDSRPA